jgi:hypothetical protein
MEHAFSRNVPSPGDCKNYDSCNDSRLKSRLTPSSSVNSEDASPVWAASLGGGPPHKDELCYEGKICGLHFNRFGDFGGFWLETEKGNHKFRSRKKEVERLARRAWEHRIPVLVIVDHDDCAEPISIVYMHPTAGL